MNKLLVKQNQVTLISALPYEVLAKASVVAPFALVINEENAQGDIVETFKVTVGHKSDIKAYGISFGEMTTGEKKLAKATVTISALSGCKTDEDKKRLVAEYLGEALINLAYVENEVVEALKQYEENLAKEMTKITIVGGSDEE